jgi:RNA polymerase sigma-70 factor (ECF subfamily)
MDDRPRTVDKATLERVRRRDRAAMNDFFEAYFDRVYGYVVSATRNPDLAGDIVQDAFVRMHKAIDRLDPDRDPSPWVFTVAINTLRDHWRSWEHRNRGRMVDADRLWDTPVAGPLPGDSLLTEERNRGVHNALARLSPADREVIWLRSYEDLPFEAVAEALGSSVEAARQRHSRAVRRLGKAYKEEDRRDRVKP